MKIVKQYDWNHRDFSFDAECESCGHVDTYTTGYDDQYYYTDVVPSIKCQGCGKTTNDIGAKVEPPQLKHNPFIIM